jgi:hypothetical protein
VGTHSGTASCGDSVDFCLGRADIRRGVFALIIEVSDMKKWREQHINRHLGIFFGIGFWSDYCRPYSAWGQWFSCYQKYREGHNR